MTPRNLAGLSRTCTGAPRVRHTHGQMRLGPKPPTSGRKLPTCGNVKWTVDHLKRFSMHVKFLPRRVVGRAWGLGP